MLNHVGQNDASDALPSWQHVGVADKEFCPIMILSLLAKILASARQSSKPSSNSLARRLNSSSR